MFVSLHIIIIVILISFWMLIISGIKCESVHVKVYYMWVYCFTCTVRWAIQRFVGFYKIVPGRFCKLYTISFVANAVFLLPFFNYCYRTYLISNHIRNTHKKNNKNSQTAEEKKENYINAYTHRLQVDSWFSEIYFVVTQEFKRNFILLRWEMNAKLLERWEHRERAFGSKN